MTSRLLKLIAPAFLALAATCAPLVCAAETLSGAGSSAAAPMYRAWATAYSRSHNFELAYEPVGSSAGVKNIREGQVGFGASDVPPSAQELAQDGLVLAPTFVTGAVPIVNLPRIGNGKLRLNQQVLAAIFLGEITRWSAPEIQRLNAGLTLPDLPIRLVVRSDGSGTTYYFTDYLSRISPAWRDKVGAKTTVAWPASFLSAKGSDGVAKAVKETVGALSYIEFNHIADHSLNPVQLHNAAGEFVAPGAEGFRAALRASDWFNRGDFQASLANLPGKHTWPITMGSFILLPSKSDKPAETSSALRFFVWALLKGDQAVDGNRFVRLPDKIQSLVFKTLSGVTDHQGKAIGLDAWQAVSSQ